MKNKNTKKGRILWIDDSINRFALTPYVDEFEDSGYEVVRAENPDEADGILAVRQDFQCIIVDLVMPRGEKISCGESRGGMRTGLVVIKKFIANPALDHAKKVMCTIMNDAAVRDYCVSRRIPYMEKQRFLPDAFVREIEKIIRG